MRIVHVLAVLVAGLSFSACDDGDDTGTASTTTLPSGDAPPATTAATVAETLPLPVTDTAATTSEPPASDTPATSPGTDAPTSAPATTASPRTDPPLAPPTTDVSTGLHTGPVSIAPPGVRVPEPAANAATLAVVAGSHSYSASGGTCSVIEGYTYVFVGELAGLNASLSWETANPAAGQFLAWRFNMSGNGSTISTHGLDRNDAITITFGEAGTSGTFAGWYLIPGEEPNFRQFTGSFSCLPAPLVLLGDHPVSFLNARCNGSDAIAAGSTDPFEPAAYLAIDTESIDPFNDFDAALTWRVDGVVYETSFVRGHFSDDRLGASFIGHARAVTGGDLFVVTGSFNCLGGG